LPWPRRERPRACDLRGSLPELDTHGGSDQNGTLGEAGRRVGCSRRTAGPVTERARVRIEGSASGGIQRTRRRRGGANHRFQRGLAGPPRPLRLEWIWTRPGLDRRTRGCITLTALVVLGRLEELEMHVRTELRNGLCEDEIGEVLLHGVIYCVPAADARVRGLDAPSRGEGWPRRITQMHDAPGRDGGKYSRVRDKFVG
jgi:hypothetical protein